MNSLSRTIALFILVGASSLLMADDDSKYGQYGGQYLNSSPTLTFPGIESGQGATGANLNPIPDSNFSGSYGLQGQSESFGGGYSNYSDGQFSGTGVMAQPPMMNEYGMGYPTDFGGYGYGTPMMSVPHTPPPSYYGDPALVNPSMVTGYGGGGYHAGMGGPGTVQYGGTVYGAGIQPYYKHFGSGYYRHSEAGHLRFPYYSYRAPWYFPGPAVFNRGTNLPW